MDKTGSNLKFFSKKQTTHETTSLTFAAVLQPIIFVQTSPAK
jgi:hypothetical protein